MSQNAGEKFNSTEFDNETRQDVNVLINEIESNVHIGTIDKVINNIQKNPSEQYNLIYCLRLSF